MEKGQLKSIIITALVTLLSTLFLEEYRLYRSNQEKEQMKLEKQKVTQQQQETKKYAKKLDSLLELSVVNNQLILNKHKDLEKELLNLQQDNKNITQEAIELTKLDSIDMISPTEYDSIRMQLRQKYHD